MAGLEELRKKLTPLFDAEKGFSTGSTLDPSDSYTVSFFYSLTLNSQRTKKKNPKRKTSRSVWFRSEIFVFDFCEVIGRWNSKLVEQIVRSVQYQWAWIAQVHVFFGDRWDWEREWEDVSVCFEWDEDFRSHRKRCEQRCSESYTYPHASDFGAQED